MWKEVKVLSTISAQNIRQLQLPFIMHNLSHVSYMGVKVICQNNLLPYIIVTRMINWKVKNYMDWFCLNNETALVSRMHSQPRRDLAKFIYCNRIAHQPCWYHIKPDAPLHGLTFFFYLPLKVGLDSDLVLAIFDLNFNLK